MELVNQIIHVNVIRLTQVKIVKWDQVVQLTTTVKSTAISLHAKGDVDAKKLNV
jgi:hypothetical protein